MSWRRAYHKTDHSLWDVFGHASAVRRHIEYKKTKKEAVPSTQSTSDLPRDVCVTMHLGTRLARKRSMTRCLS